MFSVIRALTHKLKMTKSSVIDNILFHLCAGLSLHWLQSYLEPAGYTIWF